MPPKIAAEYPELINPCINHIDSTSYYKDMESCVQYSVANINTKMNRMIMYVGDQYAPGGYLWIFPKGDGFANIGIGISGKYSKVMFEVMFEVMCCVWNYLYT